MVSMRRMCFAAGVALALLAGSVGPARGQGGDDQKPQGPPPALVRVGEVRQQEAQNRLDVIGRLMEVRRVVVASEETGRVVAMKAEEGDQVVGGQTPLARIDDVWAQINQRTAEAELARARAAVAEAQARLDNANRDVVYLEQLQQRQSANPKEVEDARATQRVNAAALQSAQAAVLTAQAELDRANESVTRLVILAPFDGVVVKKMTEVGQWLERGSPVAEIISRGGIDAVIDVPENLINQLRTGQDVEVLVEPLNLTVNGKVQSINPLGSSTARTFPVKLRLEDQEGKLKPSMSVLARVPSGQMTQVLTVPRDAVQNTPMGARVWANLGGKAMPIGVRVLFGLGDRYAVADLGAGPPLAQGAQVVVEGAERLFPTQPLMIVEQPASTASAR
jgi:RND family efflux transporter MFP subunit